MWFALYILCSVICVLRSHFQDATNEDDGVGDDGRDEQDLKDGEDGQEKHDVDEGVGVNVDNDNDNEDDHDDDAKRNGGDVAATGKQESQCNENVCGIG